MNDTIHADWDPRDPSVQQDQRQAYEALGSRHGMLYFCLLLAHLEARGEIARASDVSR